MRLPSVSRTSSIGKGDWRHTDIRIDVATRLGSLSVEEDAGDNERVRRSCGSRRC